MTLVKICGIRELHHARVAAESGADMLGFVFVPVRREITPDAAARIITTVRQETERPPAAVGLFVNESAARINRVVAQVGLDLVQLSGDEPPELAREIDVPVIKAVRLPAGTSLDEARRKIQAHLEYSAAVLLDSHVDGHWGGTGVVGDWDVAATLAVEFPVVLAGGLAPEIVARAIEQVNPAMVDVSSGVETDGQKEPDKIREFISAARSADRAPADAATTFVKLARQIPDAHGGNRVSA